MPDGTTSFDLFEFDTRCFSYFNCKFHLTKKKWTENRQKYKVLLSLIWMSFTASAKCGLFNLLMLVIGWYSFVWIQNVFVAWKLKTIYEFCQRISYVFDLFSMNWNAECKDTAKFVNKIEQKARERQREREQKKIKLNDNLVIHLLLLLLTKLSSKRQLIMFLSLTRNTKEKLLIQLLILSSATFLK